MYNSFLKILATIYRAILGKLFLCDGIWVIKFWTCVELHDINSFFLMFILSSSVRHSFPMAGQSGFPQSFWRASVVDGSTGVPTPHQLNRNPGEWTQAEIFCKSSSVDSNELPRYKNHWSRIAKLKAGEHKSSIEWDGNMGFKGTRKHHIKGKTFSTFIVFAAPDFL